MSAIHYKFRSAKDYDSYRFDGAGIPVWELKNEIIEAKKLNKSDDFDLVITNAQTNHDYSEDSDIIPRNTSVIVKRVPVAKGSRPKRQIPVGSTNYIPPTLPQNVQKAVGTNLSISKEEDAKILKMMNEQSNQWAQSQSLSAENVNRRVYSKPKGPALIPPPTYVCFRCGQGGHYIQNCPTNADPNFDRPRIKRTTGIPKAFLKTVNPEQMDNPSTAIMVTSEGAAVIAAPNDFEWERVSADRKSFLIDSHLYCPICKDLLNSPVRSNCCGKVFCDDCISSVLSNTTDHRCPVCKKPITMHSLSLAVQVQQEIDALTMIDSQNSIDHDDSVQIESDRHQNHRRSSERRTEQRRSISPSRRRDFRESDLSRRRR